MHENGGSQRIFVVECGDNPRVIDYEAIYDCLRIGWPNCGARCALASIH
jgi:hypothetical protein